MSNPASASALKRNFVTVTGRYGTRQVHYRQGGRGPVVFLLHQSPQSSRELEPLIAAWGHAFTLIAPDSPGYGFSDPLQDNGQPVATASMEDYAGATVELADALGIRRFGIYGFHTGASIGSAVAAAHPGRVTALAANGLVVLTDSERTTILRDYLPPLVPRWDGGHLAWLWGRMREQTIFFPWHDRRAATRMDFDVPPADRLQFGLNEFLAAGSHYHVAYAAAFIDRAELRLPAMRVPMLVTASARDPLGSHLARIGERSASVQVVPSTDSAAALARSFAHLAQHPGDPELRPGATAAQSLASGHSEYRGAPGSQVRVIRTASRDPTAGRRVILLHAPASSARSQDALAGDIAGAAEVLAVDLPGHGSSDPASGPGLAGTVAQLAAALADVGADTVIALGDSAPVALELAPKLGAATRVVLLQPSAWSAADRDDWLRLGLPALTPVWAGGHLLEAWHMIRDGRLFQPWFRREHAGIRHDEPDLDDQRIQRDVRDVLRANDAWQALLRDTLRYARPAAGPGSPRVTELEATPSSWASVLAGDARGHDSPS